MNAGIRIHDFPYLAHPDQTLTARVFTPGGDGPFPAVVEVHGGAWCEDNRESERFRHQALARSGIVVVSLQFRQGSAGAYPRSVADINYGVRWVKSRARDLRTRPDRVGLCGQSSGGHLAMLAAMRPRDPRYAAIALPSGSPEVDASVRCVALSWPVINPLGRYRMVVRERERPSMQTPGGMPDNWAESLIRRHHAYWESERNMEDGSPMLILERGEKVETPPALWIQPPNDPLHDYRDPASDFAGGEAERFARNYRRAGGEIDLVYVDAPLRFTTLHPTLPASVAAFERIAGFVHRAMR